MGNLVSGLHLPDKDSFTVRLRKLGLMVSLYVGISACLISIPLSSIRLATNPTWAAVCYMCYALSLATGVLHFAYGRYHQSATAKQMLVVYGTGAVATTFNCLARPMNFANLHSMLICILVWLMELDNKKPFIIWAVIINAIDWWNKAVIETRQAEWEPYLLVAPGAEIGGELWWRLSDWILTWGVFAAIAFAAIDYMTKAYRASIRGSQFSNDVVEHLVEKIKIFDIEGARESLEVAKQELDPVSKRQLLNKQFAETLTTVCDQLDSYRPYLPNWLLMAQETESVRSGDSPGGLLPGLSPAGVDKFLEDDMVRQGSESSAGEHNPLNEMVLKDADLSDISSDGDPENSSNNSNSRSIERSHLHDHLSNGAPNINVISGSSSATWDNSSGEPHPLDPQNQHQQQRRNVVDRLVSSQGARAVKTQRKITICILDFEPKKGKLRKEPAYLEMVQSVIDAVAKAAKTTHASIHGTTGDRIVATWNAVLTITQPELKACQFLCQVKAHVKKHMSSSIALSGAAKTGQAWCHHIISHAGGRSSSFMIHYLWRSALEALCRHARAYRTLLVDEQTFDVGQLHVEGWLVDALKLGRETLPNGEPSETFTSILDAPAPSENLAPTSPPTEKTTTVPLLDAPPKSVGSRNSATGTPGVVSLINSGSGQSTTFEGSSCSSSANLGGGTPPILAQGGQQAVETGGTVMLCFELLREKKVADAEWLYALKESAAGPHETVTVLARTLWCHDADESSSQPSTRAPSRAQSASAGPGSTADGTLVTSITSSVPSCSIQDPVVAGSKGTLATRVRDIQSSVQDGTLPTGLMVQRFIQYAEGIVNPPHNLTASTLNQKNSVSTGSSAGQTATPSEPLVTPKFVVMGSKSLNGGRGGRGRGLPRSVSEGSFPSEEEGDQIEAFISSQDQF